MESAIWVKDIDVVRRLHKKNAWGIFWRRFRSFQAPKHPTHMFLHEKYVTKSWICVIYTQKFMNNLLIKMQKMYTKMLTTVYFCATIQSMQSSINQGVKCRLPPGFVGIL